MSTDATSAPKPRPFRRWALRLIGAVAVLYVVANLALYLLARSARARWIRLAAEIRAGNEPLSYDEIVADLPPVEDGEDPAVQRLLDELETAASRSRKS